MARRFPPLTSAGKTRVKRNIRRLKREGRSPRKAVRIALAIERRGQGRKGLQKARKPKAIKQAKTRRRLFRLEREKLPVKTVGTFASFVARLRARRRSKSRV